VTARGADFEPEAGQQLYALVESCRKPEVLWDKLRTGNYDWLGLRRGGRFVIGRPRLSAVVAFHDEAVETESPDVHRVEISGPLDRRARHEGHPSAEEARAACERIIAGDPVTPLRNSGIWKVRLIVDGAPVEERLVVRTLPRIV
jgi:hypothetical protein